MSQLQIFNFEQNEVRTILVNNEPFFVGKDVAETLGYSNTAKAIRDHVDIEDRRSERIVHPSGGTQDSVVINESGLYSLILKSKLPNARKFKQWVTNEVLPSIRKHGAYMTDDALEKALTSPEFGIRLLTELKNEREQKEQAQQQLKAQEPQIVFAKSVEVSQNSVAVKVLATILKQNGVSIGQNRMFQWLREHKYLSSRPGKSWNMPTQKSMDKGLFELKANTYFHNNGVPETNYTPLVTGKGQVYFVNKFKNEFLREVAR
ncbi:phage antirepressor [Enterococcus casseliflavus]|uniref:phage antirepressor n=1 Tax=Enterococcus casseliflavus TaxID=37734 RepID=UPI00177EAF09|nr:phage antirepressor [Enterococcus casseliflavus]QOG31626.1 hypothetical protein EGM182_12765 [Enterococcus casseliflavus]